MRKFLFVCFAVILFLLSCDKNQPEKKLWFRTLTVDYMKNPIGLDSQTPVFTWKMASSEPGGKQESYQIIVASDHTAIEKGEADMWDSGVIADERSVNIPYAGKPLESGKRYFWRVCVTDNKGNTTGFSDVNFFEMAKLHPSDWEAGWISAVPDAMKAPDWSPAPYFRKEFKAASGISWARLYISGLGYFKAYINGKKVGDHELDPVFTRYDRRVKYLIFDVRNLIDEGENCLGVVLGNGWYNQHTRSAWDLDSAEWRNPPALLAQLEIEYQDGNREVMVTNESWKVGTGPIIFDGIRNGEHYDARLELPGWSEHGFDDSRWNAAYTVNGPDGSLSPQLMPPIRVIREVRPLSIVEHENTFVLDFGENLVGRLRINGFSGSKGQQLIMRYGERLDDTGKLDQRELARFIWTGETQTDRYICRGGAPESWESSFVYHGFQYVELEGLEQKPKVEDFTAVVLHTDLRQIGEFQCSNTMFNSLQENLLSSFLGNYHGYPTDCPHREKIGWSGDAQLVAETGLYNFDMIRSYLKWIDDFADEQRPDGKVPAIIPTSGWGYTHGRGPGSEHGYGPHWDAAYVNIPWDMYMFTGDENIIQRYYEGFRDYMDYLEKSADHYILDYGIDDHKPVTTQTSPDILSTGYFYQLSCRMADMAGILDRTPDREHFLSLSDSIKKAFNERFLDEKTGIYGNGGQTSMAGALYLDLVPDAFRDKVIDNLLREIDVNDRHIDAGVVGTRYMLKALSGIGYGDLMYEIADKRDFPGWGYWIDQGATTFWQTWEGDMSLNHIMFGSIGAWFYSDLGGIRYDPQKPGMKSFIIRPIETGSLEWVNCSYESLYGEIKSNWKRDDSGYHHEVSVPFNTEAVLYLPKIYGDNFRESADENGLYVLQEDEDLHWILKLKPGNYHFVVY